MPPAEARRLMAATAAPLWRALAAGTVAASPNACCRRLYATAGPNAGASHSANAGATAAAAAAAPESWPVIIAGGGPTGLTTALLLAKYGVRSLVLERGRALTDHPQAHLINMRCMEVLRGLGGGAEGDGNGSSKAGAAAGTGAAAGRRRSSVAAQVVQRMPPLEQWRRFVYCNGMSGEVLGMVDHFK